MAVIHKSPIAAPPLIVAQIAHNQTLGEPACIRIPRHAARLIAARGARTITRYWLRWNAYPGAVA